MATESNHSQGNEQYSAISVFGYASIPISATLRFDTTIPDEVDERKKHSLLAHALLQQGLPPEIIDDLNIEVTGTKHQQPDRETPAPHPQISTTLVEDIAELNFVVNSAVSEYGESSLQIDGTDVSERDGEVWAQIWYTPCGGPSQKQVMTAATNLIAAVKTALAEQDSSFPRYVNCSTNVDTDCHRIDIRWH